MGGGSAHTRIYLMFFDVRGNEVHMHPMFVCWSRGRRDTHIDRHLMFFGLKGDEVHTRIYCFASRRLVPHDGRSRLIHGNGALVSVRTFTILPVRPDYTPSG